VVDHLFMAGRRLNMGQPIKTLLPMNVTENVTQGFKFIREKIDASKKKKNR